MPRSVQVAAAVFLAGTSALSPFHALSLRFSCLAMAVLANLPHTASDLRRTVAGGALRRPGSVAGQRSAAAAATKRLEAEKVATSTQADAEEEFLRQRALLAGRLAKATSYSRALESQVQERDAALLRLHTAVLTLRREIVALSEKAAKAAPSVESAEAVLSLGLGIFTAVEELVETSEAHRARPVEVVWTGLADTVEIFGNWNSWTRGHHLSPETSGTWTTWRASIMLLPGPYEVKVRCGAWWALVHCSHPRTRASC